MPINCDGCNAPCCRRVGLVKHGLDRGDGVCRYLSEDNRCTIYDHRPMVCNTDMIWNSFFKGRVTREEFDLMNEMDCRELRDAEKRP